MNAPVSGHFRVESSGKHRPLTHRDDMLAGPGQHLNIGSDPLDPGGADEHRTDQTVKAAEVDIALKGVNLAAEGVAAHRHIDGPQRGCLPAGLAGVENLTGQQDHSGARTVGRHAGGQSLPQRFEKVEFPQQQADGGGFPAGNDQSVHGIEFGATPHSGRLRPGLAQCGEVFPRIALQCQHADFCAAHLTGGV